MTMVERAVAAALKRGGSLEDQHEAALLAALDAEDRELVEVHAMAGVTKACREAPEGSSLNKLLWSQRRLIAAEVVKALNRSLAQGA